MAIASRVKALLTKQKVKYKALKHPVAYTAQEIAAAQHVPGKQLAKCVLVKSEKGVTLAVLPAIQRIDFAKLKRVLRVKKLSLASEADVKQAFPDVQVGAMTPFGNVYDVPTIVEKTLTASPEIVCNAGTHAETFKLRYQDFAKLVKPKVAAFGLPFEKVKPAKKARPKKKA